MHINFFTFTAFNRLTKMVLYARIQHWTDTATYCDNTEQKAGCKCMFGGKECQLLRHSGQAKQLEMLVTMLPNVRNEQLLSVTLDCKPCKRCCVCREPL